MKDMNVAKLTSTDLPLFNGIMSDLFPGVETPTIDYSEVLIYRIIRVYGLLMIIKYIEMRSKQIFSVTLYDWDYTY